MAKVTKVLPGQIKWTYYHIDYYYDSDLKRLIHILRGEDDYYYRLTFENVLGFRAIRELWAYISWKIPFEELPDEGTSNFIYELHDVDLIVPPTIPIPGRHFFVLADDYVLDVYAEREPKLEEITEGEAMASLSKEAFVSIRDMSFLQRHSSKKDSETEDME